MPSLLAAEPWWARDHSPEDNENETLYTRWHAIWRSPPGNLMELNAKGIYPGSGPHPQTLFVNNQPTPFQVCEQCGALLPADHIYMSNGSNGSFFVMKHKDWHVKLGI